MMLLVKDYGFSPSRHSIEVAGKMEASSGGVRLTRDNRGPGVQRINILQDGRTPPWIP